MCCGLNVSRSFLRMSAGSLAAGDETGPIDCSIASTHTTYSISRCMQLQRVVSSCHRVYDLLTFCRLESTERTNVFFWWQTGRIEKRRIWDVSRCWSDGHCHCSYTGTGRVVPVPYRRGGLVDIFDRVQFLSQLKGGNLY